MNVTAHIVSTFHINILLSLFVLGKYAMKKINFRRVCKLGSHFAKRTISCRPGRIILSVR